jgi:beta-barrel assembly-enhancing protease
MLFGVELSMVMDMKLKSVAFVLSALTLALPFTGQAQFKFKLGKSQETAIGSDMYNEVKQKPGFITRGKEYDLVQRIGRRLVEANNLTDYTYRFSLVNDKEVNAFATPGGYLYVNLGLVNYMGYDESMLAGVMSHELGHIKDRHPSRGAEKQMQSQLGVSLLGLAIGKKNKDLMTLLGGAAGMANLKYGRDMEEWADRYGVELAYNAGYDPYGMARGLETLQALHGKGDNLSEWLSNHPSNSSRIKRTRQIAHEMSGHSEGYWTIPCPPKSHPLYNAYKGKCGKGKQAIDSDYPLKREDPTVIYRREERSSRSR